MLERSDDRRTETLLPRKRVWEVPRKYHESIITLCLNDHEQYRLAGNGRRSRQEAYCRAALLAVLGGYMVSMSRESLAIQQLLDGKYALSLGRFAVVGSDDEIRKLWNSQLAGGEFRGAYWAVMTHRGASAKLAEDIYQQLKTYSLQSCCLQLQQKRQCCELQRKIEALQETLAETERKHKRTICLYCSQLAGLKSELSQAEHKVSRLERHLALIRFKDSLAGIVDENIPA